tara:strand:- start:312 stop:536 length:225 start_codon:yes stop_codon:yes gene_type:complete
MEQLKLTETEFEWIEKNLTLIKNGVAVDEPFRTEVFRLYNKITGGNKKPTSCGRCWRNTKKEVYQYYLKILNIV